VGILGSGFTSSQDVKRKQEEENAKLQRIVAKDKRFLFIVIIIKYFKGEE